MATQHQLGGVAEWRAWQCHFDSQTRWLCAPLLKTPLTFFIWSERYFLQLLQPLAMPGIPSKTLYKQELVKTLTECRVAWQIVQK